MRTGHGMRMRPAAAGAAAAVVALAVVAAGCGRDDDERFRAASEAARTSTTTTPSGTMAPEVTTGAPGSGEPSRNGGATTTAAPASADPSAALLAAVGAYRAELGLVRALRFTCHFPTTGGPYASLQSQDPAVPANVDERAWRDGEVGPPEPVRLFPGTDLAAELYAFDAIAWDAVAAALPGVPALVAAQVGAPLENSDGVTHVIAESDLPFSPTTVVRVYVDGGDRSTGGYVQLRADGSVEAVRV